jgi:hypothetical protein
MTYLSKTIKQNLKDYFYKLEFDFEGKLVQFQFYHYTDGKGKTHIVYEVFLDGKKVTEKLRFVQNQDNIVPEGCYSDVEFRKSIFKTNIFSLINLKKINDWDIKHIRRLKRAAIESLGIIEASLKKETPVIVKQATPLPKNEINVLSKPELQKAIDSGWKLYKQYCDRAVQIVADRKLYPGMEIFFKYEADNLRLLTKQLAKVIDINVRYMGYLDAIDSGIRDGKAANDVLFLSDMSTSLATV